MSKSNFTINNPMLEEINNTPKSFDNFFENLSNLEFNKRPHTFGREDKTLLNDFANYLITYLFIIIGIMNDDNNLLIAACLITPFPNDLKTTFFNILEPDPSLTQKENNIYIFFIIFIIALYFVISILFGLVSHKNKNKYSYTEIEDKFNINNLFAATNWYYTLLISAFISISVCFYSLNFSNNSGNNIGMGIALTLLPALVISGYNYGKIIQHNNIIEKNNKINEHNINIDRDRIYNIYKGAGFLFLLNFSLYIVFLSCCYIFFKIHNWNNRYDKNFKNLFYFEKSLEEIFNELKEDNSTINSLINPLIRKKIYNTG